MNVAIIAPPLIGHEGRGTGVYTTNLIKALEVYTQVEVIHATIDTLPSNIDLYHFPYFDPFFLTLPRVKQKKAVVTVHDLIPLRFPAQFPRGIKGEIKWQIQRHALKSADAIITDSLASKSDIVKYTGVDPQKVNVVYLAPEKVFFEKHDIQEKKTIKGRYHLPEKFALYVGEGNWNKNLPLLIKAAISAETPLVIVSKSFVERQEIAYHPWKESLVEAQEEAKKSSMIYKLGRLDTNDLVILYQSATVLVLPSLYEGFGLPIVEAFAAGCPVISSDRGSLKEVAGEGALIVNPEKTEDIAEALKRVFNENELRKTLIEKGRNQVNLFSWKKTAEETSKIYSQVSFRD